jgi:energy-coupling factor transporter ATP-binding protein EcfA2
MLEARGLAVAPPGGTSVFEGLDLEVRPGEWVALTGPNGGGKSLLCLALAGLLGPRNGIVRADGALLAPHAPERASVGMVFQEPEAQLVAPTLEEEIAFPLENLGWQRAAIVERVRRLVEEFDLSALAGRSPSSLSGGEKSRLGLAAALASDPKYLILDEPGVYLDARARERLRALVRREVERGRGALFVTQLEEEWRAADRRLRLERGTLYVALDGEPVSTRGGGAAFVSPGEDGTRLLGAQGLGFDYGGGVSPLLAGVDLEIREGEVVLLTGASGAGKTTLLLLLCGILEPNSGTVELDRASPLGVLLQSPEDQLVSGSVAEDIALGAKGGTVTVSEALLRVGLDPARHAGRPPSALSHGERRRAAWAGLLARKAKVWLLDEPSTGLDEAGVMVLETTLNHFVSSGGAALVASQDPRLEAWRIRRYLLEGGSVHPQGTPLPT